MLGQKRYHNSIKVDKDFKEIALLDYTIEKKTTVNVITITETAIDNGKKLTISKNSMVVSNNKMHLEYSKNNTNLPIFNSFLDMLLKDGLICPILADKQMIEFLYENQKFVVSYSENKIEIEIRNIFDLKDFNVIPKLTSKYIKNTIRKKIGFA